MSPNPIGSPAGSPLRSPSGRPFPRLPLASSGLDRAAERRAAPDLFDQLWAQTSTRVLVVHDRRVLMTPDGAHVALLPVEQVYAATLRIFLGRTRQTLPSGTTGSGADALPVGADIVAATVSDRFADSLTTEPARWAGLRQVGPVLPAEEAGLFTAALALANWHAGFTFCPRCGGPTIPAEGGWTRTCLEDGSQHYPRTDPAVIMSVVDADDRLLLGHGANWPATRFSTLAGFVEPGEQLEDAVAREVAEEVGLVVDSAEYLGSQPWPFPGSLMLGFAARAATTDVAVDGREVTEARWFTRRALDEAVVAGTVQLPSGLSISHALIERWYGGPIAGVQW